LRALWAASILGGLAQSLAGAAGALLARRIGDSDAVAGLPQACLVLGSAIAALGVSALTRRSGRGVALTVGALVAVLGCLIVLLGGAWGSLPGVLAGSLLLGSGNTAVMLGRYAAADLGPETSRPQAMASVLTATTIGAVAGPNLLAPAANLAIELDVPALLGPYLFAAVGFTAAAGALAAGLNMHRVQPVSDFFSTAPNPPFGTRAAGLERRVGSGLAVLGVANLVMVAVMTMAPVQLRHHDVGLTAIGLIVSVHIAGMFAPSPLSGWLTGRLGAAPVAAGGGGLLVVACGLAAVDAGSPLALGAAMVLLGAGWNMCLVAGSDLLTADVSPVQRPRREGWGEVSMGIAAAGGGAASGGIVAAGGYPALATGGAVVAAFLLPLVWFGTNGHPQGFPPPPAGEAGRRRIPSDAEPPEVVAWSDSHGRYADHVDNETRLGPAD